MKQPLCILIMLLILIIGLSGCIEENAPSSMNSIITIDGISSDWEAISVFIEDVQGDVRIDDFNNEVLYEFDVKNIKLAIDFDYLYVLMEFVDTIDYYFDMNKEQAKIIGEIYLDTDNDENTGGEDSYLYAGGFECKLDVWSGVKNNDTETSVSGGGRLTDYTEETDLHYFIQYIPSLYDESENSVSDFPIAFDKGVTSHTQPELVAFNDNFIEFKTPLDHVDIEYSDDRIIRALFSERGSGLGTESFSDEAIRQIFIL